MGEEWGTAKDKRHYVILEWRGRVDSHQLRGDIESDEI